MYKGCFGEKVILKKLYIRTPTNPHPTLEGCDDSN